MLPKKKSIHLLTLQRQHFHFPECYIGWRLEVASGLWCQTINGLISFLDPDFINSHHLAWRYAYAYISLVGIRMRYYFAYKLGKRQCSCLILRSIFETVCTVTARQPYWSTVITWGLEEAISSSLQHLFQRQSPFTMK